MRASLNIFYFFLLYINFGFIINKFIFKKEDCIDNKNFSSILLDCIPPYENKECVGNLTQREDGLCILNNCDNDPTLIKIQKNYFGVFLNKTICIEKSNNKPVHPMDFDLDKFFQESEKKCLYEEALKCQLLLNSCALNLQGKHCSLIYNTILEKRMFLPESLLSDTSILSDTIYSLREETRNIANDNLHFWVAKYFYNGTLFLYDRLENDFLQCSNSNEEKLNYKKLGNNIISKCIIDITKYLDYKNDFFYEIYLEKNIGNQKQELVEIPIKIINENKIVKRMYLHVNKKNNPVEKPEFYYAEEVKLCVKIIKGSNLENNNNRDKIFLPHFEVKYNKKTDTDPIEYTFISEYKSEITDIYKAMYIIFIIITVIVGLLVIYRVYVWIKINPMELIEKNYFLLLLLEIIYKISKYIGKFYFWFTFGVSAYWYFFFKIQFRIYFLMPPLDDNCYKTFRIIFVIGFCCYIIYMLIRVYKQVSFDIFFIDWESEQNMKINDVVKSDLDKSVMYKKYRSAWRMIHVVNQFNELQKKRIFNLYFGFSWIVLLYFIQDHNWIGREKQIPRDDNIPNAPVNFVLRNFIAGITVLASSSVQLCLVKLLQIWIPLKKQEFMDLCSVSNISVFILDGLLHGYYIHGHSPIGKADVNYDELFKFLNAEGAGTMRNRGLENDNVPDHCNNQCYEMFISHSMRIIYDGLYIIQNESMLAKTVNTRKYIRKSKLGMRLFRNYLNSEKDQTMLDNYMNNQLRSKIDIVTYNTIQYIKDKTLLQRIMGYTIDNTAFVRINAPDIIFYRDYRQNFDDILFSGMEWEWFIMDLFVFQFLMIYTDDNYISMFVTFVFDYILYYIRIYFGNRNVAKKAVIDDRFLN